jgi:hypothetical protein
MRFFDWGDGIPAGDIGAGKGQRWARACGVIVSLWRGKEGREPLEGGWEKLLYFCTYITGVHREGCGEPVVRGIVWDEVARVLRERGIGDTREC